MSVRSESIVFDSATEAAARVLIEMALREDLSELGDLTSLSTVPPEQTATVRVVSRATGVVCGVPLLPLVFQALKEPVQIEAYCRDGDMISPGRVVASVSGRVQALLTGERTLLNFLMHLSGVASRTAHFVEQVQGTRAVILDTRKTLPGYRRLQKYAVRCGGGVNHRMGLYDGILIKDNHLAARGSADVASAVGAARQWMSARQLSLPVEIEVDTLEQLQDALRQRPEIVLLDNMDPPQLRQAVQIRDQLSPPTQLEASGGVTLATVRSIAETGVERISIGGLTHSAPALDLGFDWQFSA